MAFRALTTRAMPRSARGQMHSFSTSSRAFVKVGDSIPKLDVLVENSPGNKVNLGESIGKGRALVIGVPAAFSTLSLTFSPPLILLWSLDVIIPHFTLVYLFFS